MVNSLVYRVNNSFLIVGIVVSVLQSISLYFKGISLIPQITLLITLFFFIIYIFHIKSTSEKNIVRMISIVSVNYVFILAYFTGGFNAPVLIYLIPIIVYVFVTNDIKELTNQFLYLALLILVMGGINFSIAFPESIVPVLDHEKIKFVNYLLALIATFITLRSYKLESYRKDKEINEINESYDLMVKGSNIGLWDWKNPTAPSVYWSEKLYEILGFKNNEIEAKVTSFKERMHPDDVKKEDIQFDKSLKEGNTFNSSFRVRNKNNEYIWVSSSGLIVKDSNGSVTRIVGAIMDITDSVLVNKQLKMEKEKAMQASESKSRFLANMSHEIRTPMNGIIGLTDYLLGNNLDKDTNDSLNDISISGKYLLSIIDDLLDYSKIETSKLKLNYSDIDINTLFNELKTIFDRVCVEKNIEFLIKPLAMKHLCRVDEVRLKQVLINLVGNAIKFTKNGSVTVEYRIEKDNLNVNIVDTGIGIEEENFDLIFNSFEQVENNMTKNYKGTGLGLTITKRLVELMGGKIKVSSVVGRGTVFRFNIKTKILEDISENESVNPIEFVDGELKHLRILVAEDNLMNLKVVEKYLNKLNISFDYAENGKDALELTKKNTYDIILMDLQMPVMDGITSTVHIRKLKEIKKPYIIALTANAFSEDKIACANAGMDDFLSKPYKFIDLKIAFKKYLQINSLL